MVNLMDKLPAVYQGEEMEGSPLAAIVSLADKQFSEISSTIDRIEQYFDPMSELIEETEGFLQWLSSWVALTLDAEWSMEKKRYTILNAASFYMLRGTRRGLEILLEHFFEMRVDIQEWRKPTMVIGHSTTIGHDTIIQKVSGADYHFSIVCFLDNYSHAKRRNLERKVRHIIDQEKPAHTVYDVAFEYGSTVVNNEKGL